jgi:hypothetical protein
MFNLKGGTTRMTSFTRHASKARRRTYVIGVAAIAALVLVSAALASTSRTTVKPVNSALPAIGGDPSVGSTLTANPGNWTGSTPITYQYQWQVCNAGGSSCHDLSGANAQTYQLKSGDQGNALRVDVIASNADGSTTAVSAPTDKVGAAATPAPAPAPAPSSNGCPKTAAGSDAVAAADVTTPARLQIAGFVSSPAVITRAMSSFSVRFHIADTCGQAVSGAQVFATAVPYGQVSIPGQAATNGSGDVTLTFNRRAGFPAGAHQQRMVMFVRASKPGDPLLAGISTRRLISLKVNLNG